MCVAILTEKKTCAPILTNNMLRSGIIAVVFGLLATSGQAAECRDMTHLDNKYTICEVDISQEKLRLFLNNSDGVPYGHFSTINKSLGDKRLTFAMNAGMYHKDRAPVGHYVENGVEHMRVIPNAGPGNFGLLPNGVLCIGETRVDVVETKRFLREKPNCEYATQSGPMLVIDGALHPRFLVHSKSRHIRNGVGTSQNGKRAIFAISNNTVTFHEFASMYRDALGISQALYFDGKVSRLHAPSLNRSDAGFWLGPIVGTVSRD